MPDANKNAPNNVASDMIHNENCFRYLKLLKLPNSIIDKLPSSLAQDLQVIQTMDYKSDFPFADIYTQFFKYVEDNIDILYNEPQAELHQKIALINAQLERAEQSFREIDNAQKPLIAINIKGLKKQKADLETAAEDLDLFMLSIYDNDNHILEHTYAKIKDLTIVRRSISHSIEKSIAAHVVDQGQSPNRTHSPARSGSVIGRFDAMISDNYKPQHSTSLATVRHYKWSDAHQVGVREYRIGTQGQRQDGVERVSPLYEAYLVAQKRRFPDKNITHIYFNNLGRDRTDWEGHKEKALTQQLENLEVMHTNVAVITLPADKGLMAEDHYKETRPRHEYAQVKRELLQIACEEDGTSNVVKDFYISPSIRKLLFAGKDKEKLQELLNSSFTAMGIKQNTKLSVAQQQAVWFHFIKFELTNYIITTLKPVSMNFSCKDAIDRGGVSSAYYNLLKSFTTETPMDREEFERGLHAAPTMVKGRGMNHHINLIWNTVNNYVDNNYPLLRDSPGKAWLIQWRDMNYPHARINKHSLVQRINELIQDLNDAKDLPQNKDKKVGIEKGLSVLNLIKNHASKDVSGKRILLEAAVRTAHISLNPTDEAAESYQKFAENIPVQYPVLRVIGGALKAFFGYISSQLHEAGKATMKAGLNYSERDAIHAQMKAIHSQMKQQISDLKGVKDVEKDADNKPNVT